ncbi:MAG TPA: hypothetical protein VNZ26_28155, partial [Vicinamibacterales bacterium]|nr:hypothetical protein [Vicinamibacterales bacterium]
RFSRLTPGTYTLVIVAPGYALSERSVAIIGHEATTIDVELALSPHKCDPGDTMGSAGEPILAAAAFVSPPKTRA